ncbi:MAG: hypothetical protein AAF456_04860 [Planctomycetota bacterium]
MAEPEQKAEAGSRADLLIAGFDIDDSFVWPWRIASGLLVVVLGGMWVVLLVNELTFGLIATPVLLPLIWVFACRGHFTGKTDFQLFRDRIRYKSFLLWHQYRYEDLAGFAVQRRAIANKAQGDVLFLKTSTGKVRTMFVLHTFARPEAIVPALESFTRFKVERIKDFDLRAFDEWKTSKVHD